MTAMQAQDYGGALTSVALRTKSRLRRDVEAALCAGDVVRSWPMRGTLHFVVAGDLPWMLQVMAHRVVAGSAARRAGLGLDNAVLERGHEVAAQALRANGPATRADLLAAWERAGITTADGRGGHLVGYLAQTGILCFGPVLDGVQRLVLIDDWIPAPRRLEKDEALGELARRYFCSHGPATVKDFTRWTNLVAADVRVGMALAQPGLATIDVDGVEHFMDPETPDRLAACRRSAEGVLLLPGFDEFILGYADRTAQLPAQFADRIVPGGNGMFKATVVSGGAVVGTWKRSGRGAKQHVEATPLASFPDGLSATISQVYADLP